MKKQKSAKNGKKNHKIKNLIHSDNDTRIAKSTMNIKEYK